MGSVFLKLHELISPAPCRLRDTRLSFHPCLNIPFIRTNHFDYTILNSDVRVECDALECVHHHHHHHQRINVPTAGAKAFLMDYT
jgi:hypothetical protein